MGHLVGIGQFCFGWFEVYCFIFLGKSRIPGGAGIVKMALYKCWR